MQNSNSRIGELDFLKFVFIVLMVAFHLVYIGETYPYAKKIVYTFHMPAFLLISGYLTSVAKSPKPFFRSRWWLFVPYVVMESGYVIMASCLPIREHIDNLTVTVFFEKVLLHPLGPYWYLHTLILCSIFTYVVFMYVRIGNLSRFIVLGLLFYLCSAFLHIVSFSCACYFLAGVVIRQTGQPFLRVVRPSAWAVVPLVLICCYPRNLDISALSGFVIVYLVMSFLLFIYQHIRDSRLCPYTLFIGRNTLLILLFSPIFTILAKSFLPYLSFDKTGMLFLLLALTFTLLGCFLIGYIMDKSRLSRYFYGKERILQ
jgi:fucose 4-O-acetylase-like acetyltransferase